MNEYSTDPDTIRELTSEVLKNLSETKNLC